MNQRMPDLGDNAAGDGGVDGAQLAPGSEAAVAAGCRCPVMDNGRGMGAYGGACKDERGATLFWINAECPLHGPASQLD